jgi:topoisomerase-4 subunit A
VFEVIEAKHVAIANTRLYWNKDEGFIGTSLKKDEFLFECSDLDDIIAFTKGGVMKVVKVAGQSIYW